MSFTRNDSHNSSFDSIDRKRLLQTLYHDTNNIGNKVSNPPEMIQETKNVLTQANNLFKDGKIEEGVQNPDESYLDSQVMKATSEVVIQCSQAISTDMNKYDKTELAESIHRNSDFWCFTFPYEAPAVTFLYGASNDAPRPRTQRAPRARALQHQQAVPRTDRIAQQNEEETKKAKKMFKKLESACRDEPMCYFDAVIDPSSFSRSVENIYHLSFMVRDGLLAVFNDDKTGLPYIKTHKNHSRKRICLENASEKRDEGEKQFIVSINMDQWKELVEAFVITEPFFET